MSKSLIFSYIGHVLNACLLLCLSASISLGCLYTVRDIGFVDINNPKYNLHLLINDDTPKEMISTLNEIAYAAFIDTNIKADIININSDDKRYKSLKKYHDFWEIDTYPSAILVSPNGLSLSIPLLADDMPFRESVWSSLDKIVISPKRDELFKHIIKSFCVILLIEGSTTFEDNDGIRKAITTANDEFAARMNQMTRSVEKPPYLVTISAKSRQQERILLWSLGLNEKAMEKTQVVFFYGKGRKIGPIIKGQDINREMVLEMLDLIGSACECGLERGWLEDIALPTKWGEKMQKEAIKQLGFDPESPIIKTEISQIINQAQSENITENPQMQIELYTEESVISDEKASFLSPAQLASMNSQEQKDGEAKASIDEHKETKNDKPIVDEPKNESQKLKTTQKAGETAESSETSKSLIPEARSVSRSTDDIDPEPDAKSSYISKSSGSNILLLVLITFGGLVVLVSVSVVAIILRSRRNNIQ